MWIGDFGLGIGRQAPQLNAPGTEGWGDCGLAIEPWAMAPVFEVPRRRHAPLGVRHFACHPQPMSLRTHHPLCASLPAQLTAPPGSSGYRPRTSNPDPARSEQEVRQEVSQEVTRPGSAALLVTTCKKSNTFRQPPRSHRRSRRVAIGHGGPGGGGSGIAALTACAPRMAGVSRGPQAVKGGLPGQLKHETVCLYDRRV